VNLFEGFVRIDVALVAAEVLLANVLDLEHVKG
jgi:hypothetical protein